MSLESTKLNEKIEIAEMAYYTIIASSYLRQFTIFNVAATLHDPKNVLTESCTICAKIETQEGKCLIEKNTVIKPNSTEMISLNIGELFVDLDYRLVVTALDAIEFRHETSLQHLSKLCAILVQTDKPEYKPNEIVHFRVLVVDSELKAATLPSNKLNVTIHDANDNRLKQWDKVDTIHGVFEADFKISDQPNMGVWGIHASVGEEKKSKLFPVNENLPPKFEMFIEREEKQSIKSDYLIVKAVAKYFYGKEMKGNVIVGIYHNYDDKVIAEKTAKLSEKVKFKMLEEIPEAACYTIKAKAFEKGTDIRLEATDSVYVEENYYGGTIDSDGSDFTVGKSFEIKIKITKLNGSAINITDHNRTITVIREDKVFDFYNGRKENYEETLINTFELDSSAQFKLIIKPNESHRYISITVYYENEKIDYKAFSKKTFTQHNRMETQILTDDPSTAKEITVNVSPNLLINNTYSYAVIAHKQILFAETVNKTNNENTMKLPVTSEMSDGAQIIIFTIINGDIVSDVVDYDIEPNFEGNLKAKFSTEVAKPGDCIEVEITANNKAFIGLLCVDKCVIADNNDNDLKLEEAIREKNSFLQKVSRYRHREICPREWRNFNKCSLILFTNVEVRKQSFIVKRRIMKKSGRGGEICMILDTEVTIRKDFPERWIWESIYDDGCNGKHILKKKVPDSLTTWILTAFSIDPEVGLSIIKEPKSLKVFQPFFVSIDVPYSVKRSEIVRIPLNVFNYLEKEITVKLIIKNDFNDYAFVELIDQNQTIKELNINVSANDSITSFIYIKPIRIGKIPITAVAISDETSDGIRKTLFVIPEGVPQYINKSVFVDLREKQTLEALDVEIEIPKEAIPDSTRVEVHCVGDLLGGTIKNLSRLIRLPMGCGEQNMMSFVPNIVILNYLKNTNQLTPEIERKTKKYTEIGYQTQLTYKHYDGGFSCFGIRDKKGCTWLTAFVVKSFRQAAEHIAIDERIIEESLGWLAQKQDMDGNFNEEGSIWDREMQGGSAKGVALTAYVLTAFLENKHKHDKYNCVIDKAIKYIEKCHSEVTDLYALGLLSYALQHIDCPIKTEVFDRFFKLSRNANDLLWWEKAAEKEKSEKWYCRLPATFNIELTAYGLLALMKSDKPNQDQCLSVLKWLLSQRNSRGGFEGTQDTVVGLEALAKYAEKISSNDRDILIEFEASGANENFMVNDNNALVHQSKLLTSDMKKINVKAKGKGFALFDVSYKYNLNHPPSSAAFKLCYDVKILNETDFTIDISLSFNGLDNNAKSNMAVMEVTMPSGFIIELEYLRELLNDLDLVKRTETKNSDTIAIVYFENIGRNELKISIRGVQAIEVNDLKPASITVYDYYDSSLRTQTSYLLAAK